MISTKILTPRHNIYSIEVSKVSGLGNNYDPRDPKDPNIPAKS